MDKDNSSSLAGWDPEYDPMMSKHHIRVEYDLNSNIIVAVTISLLVMVVLVVILHLYTRCVLQRQARHRAARQQMHIGEPLKTGLSPAVIASLPMFVFKRTGIDDKMTATECIVCLSILEDDEMARLLPNCKHIFHAKCIDKWLRSQSTCPICRNETEPPPIPPYEHLEADAPPTASPLERVKSPLESMEGTSDGGA